MQQDVATEDVANTIKRTPDEEIKACFEAAKQKLDRLLKSRKQVIQDLARELERLGRRREDIAAEIVHGLRNCEELSRSQIYSYLDDKYKNQTQAQRRKGKESNPDPKTGTESLLPEQGTTQLEEASDKHNNALYEENAELKEDLSRQNAFSKPIQVQFPTCISRIDISKL